MARTVAAGSATVSGTGRSSRIKRCRHFARQPCAAVAIRAVGVISAKSGSMSIFCTAATFPLQPQDTPCTLSIKPDIA
ncbi:MAG: hypothetical protein R3D90_09755 [Paracoccaceae bacterium]